MRTCLSNEPGFEVLGAASDGQKALDLIDKLKPDLITLDMEMPKLSGLEVLERLGREHPRLKVIVVSCSSETNAAKTLKALELGAFDFIIKPDAAECNPKKYLQDRLFPKIKQARSLRTMLGKKRKPVSEPDKKKEEKKNDGKQQAVMRTGTRFRPDLIAIGSSTGGPAALHTVLEGLPASFPIPITITQHMPKLFINSLAERLNQGSKLNCSVAEQGEVLKPGHVYIAPGDIHMKIIRDGLNLVVQLEEGPRVNHSIPSVDVTYESLVELAPRVKTLALILTGLGNDGAKAAKQLSEHKNHVIVQDEESSVVWGMPGETFRLGAANEVLPLNEISAALIFHAGL